jgi:hypothetical protein
LLRTLNHTLLSCMRLPQLGGPGSRIYIPQEQGGRVIPPRSLGSLYIVSFDLPLTTCRAVMEVSNLPPTWRAIYIPQELVGQVQSQSHVMTNGQSISMSWSLVHTALGMLHPNEFQSDIRRGILRRNFLCYHWKGCM